MNRIRKYIILLFFIMLGQKLFGFYKWPMKNDDGNFEGPLKISATNGDYSISTLNYKMPAR